MQTAFHLDREWESIADRTVAQVWPAWQRRKPALRRFADARDLLRVLHAAPAAANDRPLRALLELASTDRLAGRVVLQAFLPAFTGIAKRLPHPDRDEAWELVFYSAWITISTYPTNRRQRHIAANLVLDVFQHTLKEVRSLPPTEEDNDNTIHLNPDHLTLEAVVAPPAPQTTGVIEAVAASGVIAEGDLELILRTRVDGEKLKRLAGPNTGSYAALRKRRQRAERRLRALLRRELDVPFWGLSQLSFK